MQRRFYVYALLDPTRSGRMEFWPCSFLEEPFYVGKGTGDRAHKHKYDRRSSKRLARLVALKEAGLRPSVCVLADNLTEDEAFAMERYFIAKIGRADRLEGPLLNKTAGGQGMSGIVMSTSTRLKMSIARKGKKRPPEFGAAVSAGKKGKPQTKLKGRMRDPDITRRVAEAQRGKPRPHMIGHFVSEEARAKISTARQGYKPSPEAIAKMAATKRGKPNLKQRGVPKPAHVIEALRAGHRRWALENSAKKPPRPSPEERAARKAAYQFKAGRFVPESERENLRAKLTGRKKSLETCARISAGKRGKPSKLKGRKRPLEVGAKVSASKKGKPNLKARGVPCPHHVVAAMQAGIAKKRAELRMLKEAA